MAKYEISWRIFKKYCQEKKFRGNQWTTWLYCGLLLERRKGKTEKCNLCSPSNCPVVVRLRKL